MVPLVLIMGMVVADVVHGVDSVGVVVVAAADEEDVLPLDVVEVSPRLSQ